jgi:hypothetical protein
MAPAVADAVKRDTSSVLDRSSTDVNGPRGRKPERPFRTLPGLPASCKSPSASLWRAMAFRATAKIDLDPLEKERRTIERRRTDDENRRQRILDVKQRTFGVRHFVSRRITFAPPPRVSPSLSLTDPLVCPHHTEIALASASTDRRDGPRAADCRKGGTPPRRKGARPAARYAVSLNACIHRRPAFLHHCLFF